MVEGPLTGEPSLWIPMTDPGDVAVLSKLLEELGELTSAAARCLAQGITESEPVTNKRNDLWLRQEISDVLAMIDVVRFRFFPAKAFDIEDRRHNKRKFKQQWIDDLDNLDKNE